MKANTKRVPKDFEVKPLRTEKQRREAVALCHCLSCGRWWDDAVSTSWTPTPSGRCPFEYFH
jgi:hypothetical protein